MLQGIGTAGRSFWRRPWLKRGCCANDDDDDDIPRPTALFLLFYFLRTYFITTHYIYNGVVTKFCALAIFLIILIHHALW